MIDRIFKTVKALLNTDGIGNFKPSDFDLILHSVVVEKFEELFFEVNQLLNRQNRGLITGGLDSLTDNVREKIQYYIVPKTTLTYAAPYFTLPADMRYFDNVLYTTATVELCKSNTEFEVVKTTNPTVEYPIGLKQGTSLLIEPATIITNVTASYLRNPLQAKWTYTIINGEEIFNISAGDYQDVDIHPSEESDVLKRVALNFGVNLKEKDIQQHFRREEYVETQQENRN